MDAPAISARIEAYRTRLQDLLARDPMPLSTLLTRRQLYSVPAVYALSTPSDDLIVYAGRTRTKTLAGRIRDHVTAGTASDLSGMLKRHPDLPQALRDYCVRYVSVEDDRDRLFFEYFVIGCLAPLLNR